jgi:anthranilate synthase component 1
MRPPFDIAADLDTPVSAFLKLSSLNPRFLLESVVGGEQVGRYSIIGLGGGEPQTFGGPDVLDDLRAALADVPLPGRGVPNLPFAGGLVGACSYDLVRRFEKVPDLQPMPAEPFPEAILVAPASLLVFDHATRRCALLHDGPERDALRRDVVHALRTAPATRPHGSGYRPSFGSPTPTMDRATFMASVERIKEHILAGDVYQLVLSSAFEGPTDLDPFQVYRALRLLNPSPYMVYMELGDTSVIGSSPEALVKVTGTEATLRPIAGTRPRGQDPTHDRQLEVELLADPKEAAEHVMLVDLARNDLGRVAKPGTVRVEPYRSIERYSHVMHIVSGVVGELRPGIDPFDLFAATFPAGTVVGAPKVRAMQLIEELEPVRRGLYAGTVGYFGHGTDGDGALVPTMDQAIAIRTMTMSKGRYRYQAGAGIVADSQPEAEHAEILAKSGALVAALRLAEEGL